MVGSLVLMLTLAQVVAPAAPPLGRPSDTSPKGTATIKGRVTAADTGRPLRRARITVSGYPLLTPKATSTNVRGEYELTGLPAGRFQVRVQRSGYMPMRYGQRRSTEAARPLDVAEGQVLDKLDFALPRTGVISGRVLDETGEPVAGVRLMAMRQEFFGGRRQMVPAGPSAHTDDAGQYRIIDVPPGEYTVMAMLRETWKSGRERHTYGYAPTFFPGTARTTDAARVKVAVGHEVPNQDFALVASRAGMISGTATGADGTPLAGARVSLSMEILGSSGGMSMGITSATVAGDGTWRMADVPPGEYKVEVSTLERDRPPARASQVVLVQGGDVDGVALVADYGGTITGQLVTDTGEPLPRSTSRMRVFAESLAPLGRPTFFVSGDDNGLVASDGRFTFTGAQGSSAIRVESLPHGWTIKSVDGGDRDFAESPIEVRGGQTLDVRVVITNRFPVVSGRITDDRGNPVEGTVLLFPADSSRWYDQALQRSARPDQSGLFRFETVRPGEYLALALEFVEPWQVNDPEFLEGIQARATRVTVREGQSEALTLKLAR